MITKEQWDFVRHTDELPLHIIYDYYVIHLGNRGTPAPLNVFEKAFPQFIAQWEHIPTKMGEKIVTVTYESVVRKVVGFYEKHFYG